MGDVIISTQCFEYLDFRIIESVHKVIIMNNIFWKKKEKHIFTS